jgi:hypothetical protein
LLANKYKAPSKFFEGAFFVEASLKVCLQNVTVCGLAKVAIFTANVDAENHPESFRDD